MTSSKADFAARKTHRSANAPVSKGSEQITTVPASAHAQAAAGAPLNLTSGFTLPNLNKNGNVGYSVRITLAAGGTALVTYTVTGTWNGQAQSATVIIQGQAGAAVAGYTSVPFQTLTSITSDIDPAAATDFASADIFFVKSTRHVYIGGTGHLSLRLEEDSADSLYSALPVGKQLWLEAVLIRCNVSGRSGVTETTATLITVAR